MQSAPHLKKAISWSPPFLDKRERLLMIKDIFNPSSTCFEDKDLEKALKIYFTAPSMTHEGDRWFYYPQDEASEPDDPVDEAPSPWGKEESDEYEEIKAKIKECADFIRRSPLYKSMVQLYETSDLSQNLPIAEFIQENPVEVGKIMSQAACNRATNWIKSNISDWEGWMPCPECPFLIIKPDEEIAKMEHGIQETYLVHVLKEIALVKLIRNLAQRRERLIQILDNNEVVSAEKIKETVKTCFYEVQEAEDEQKEERADPEENNSDEIKAMANFVVEYDRLFSQEYIMRNNWAYTASVLSFLLDCGGEIFDAIKNGGRMDWEETSLKLVNNGPNWWPDHFDITKLKDIQSVFTFSKEEKELEQAYLRNIRTNIK